MGTAEHTRRLVIAGTGSGAGKTTVTIGLMAALQRRGWRVQGFKCGPDYIDPTYHTAVTGIPSRNLDSWMLGKDAVKEIFCRAVSSSEAQISIIEGVMGFYDGKNPRSNEGSTADIAMLLDAPVLLVVNCQSMARSAAAIVKGFQVLEPRAKIVGVFANKVGSEGHYRIVKEAIEQECGIPVVGYLLREEGAEVPERHLGLVPSIERGELDGLFSLLADRLTATTDLDMLWQLALSEPVHAEPALFASGGAMSASRVPIAVAKDAAFHFYYPENLELLEASGAELLYFSPLAGESLPPQAQGLYLGGGFPEEFAGTLSGKEEVFTSIREALKDGLPCLAECGGFMFLTEAIEDREGNRYPMLGILPGHVRMQNKLAALGYREVTGGPGNFLLPAGEQARGHEFHYSVYVPDETEPPPPAYETKGLRGSKAEGSLLYNIVAGYTHLHFGSNPALPKRWLDRCREIANHLI
ncbi:cobyrinate a,c-diamide synthase [Paenibacillus sp. GD4]|uniref:cobyrinate a,c-diamide synthase n=1 Tax=Paenibacillus sp. GD4 TaxID=3068890 RepID=UPI00279658F2|nr:cobyrinate a,c-diamide synthase [Paenibacillus sp. GD4]MDQ1910245.1 cobyrinate a,c-diamide synthase [Paenibacillus sp. GD4]